jgi:hypothetical protein
MTASILEQPLLMSIILDPYRPIHNIHYCAIGKVTSVLLYTLVIGHAIFSLICIISVRNGTDESRDGIVMKEAFIILWTFIMITYIMQTASLSASVLYIVRVSFVSIGLTMFCLRILISRCYRHWIPLIFDILLIRLSDKIAKIIPTIDNIYTARESSIILDINSESPIYDTNIPDSNSLTDMYSALQDPIRSKRFIMFAEQALFLRHVDFLTTVMKFMNKSDEFVIESSKQANENMKLNAQTCYHIFIRSGGERQLNIPPDIRNNIMDHLNKWNEQMPIATMDSAQYVLDDDPEQHITIFEKAFDEVSIILYQNVWQKFRAYEIEANMV